MTTQTLEPMAHATCAKCPYFQDFGEANGRGWCGVFDLVARSYHQRTSTCEQEIEVLQKEIQQPTLEAEPQPQDESVEEAGDSQNSSLQPTPLSPTEGEAGDSENSSLQPTPLSPTEYEIGRQHGQADAAERLHPIYTKPESEYAIGYLEGYYGNSTQQQPAPSQSVEWSVDYDPKWNWYRAYVGSRCIGHGSTPEQAERIAQKYIALAEMIRRQNAAVMKAYGG